MGSFTGKDLRRTAESAIHRLPENIREKLMVHSDRGSQMKSKATRRKVEEWVNVPVHFGRPHVNRERPEIFNTVFDVQNWLEYFPELYNNDPHSALEYVTPKEALFGKAEKILQERKLNLQKAREARRMAYWSSKK